MLQNLTGWHALLILAVIVLIFGAAKLPALAKSVGQSMRILKSEAGTGSTTRIDDQPADADAMTDATPALSVVASPADPATSRRTS